MAVFQGYTNYHEYIDHMMIKFEYPIPQTGTELFPRTVLHKEFLFFTNTFEFVSKDDCGCLYGEAGCNMPDPRKACMGTPACRLDVTVQYIRTDKCSGFTNYMFIEFECVPRK